MQDPPYYIYIYQIYIYIFDEKINGFRLRSSRKKNNPLTMSGQPFNTGANTWDKRAVIPPCRTCACRSPRSAAACCFVELVELRIRGIRPRMTVSFLLISKHIMLDQCWIILSFVHWFIIRLALKVNIICFKIVSRLCAPWYWKKYIVNCCSIIRKKWVNASHTFCLIPISQESTGI